MELLQTLADQSPHSVDHYVDPNAGSRPKGLAGGVYIGVREQGPLDDDGYENDARYCNDVAMRAVTSTAAAAAAARSVQGDSAVDNAMYSLASPEQEGDVEYEYEAQYDNPPVTAAAVKQASVLYDLVDDHDDAGAEDDEHTYDNDAGYSNDQLLVAAATAATSDAAAAVQAEDEPPYDYASAVRNSSSRSIGASVRSSGSGAVLVPTQTYDHLQRSSEGGEESETDTVALDLSYDSLGPQQMDA